MAKKQLINGKAYDWSSVTIDVPGCENMEPAGIDYADTMEYEAIYGRGGKIRGYGRGNYSGTFSLTLQREDYNEFCKSVAKKKKGFYDTVIEKITVSYADEGAETSTDVITKGVITGRTLKAAQGDKGLTVTLNGTIMGELKSNGVSAL